MKNVYPKGIALAICLWLSICCFAEAPMLYVYDYSYDVSKDRSVDIYGWKKEVSVQFSDDNGEVYFKDKGSKSYSGPYFFVSRQNDQWVYQRKEYRSDGVPYYPTLTFMDNFRTMTFDFGDHTAFITLDVYHWEIK